MAHLDRPFYTKRSPVYLNLSETLLKTQHNGNNFLSLRQVRRESKKLPSSWVWNLVWPDAVKSSPKFSKIGPKKYSQQFLPINWWFPYHKKLYFLRTFEAKFVSKSIQNIPILLLCWNGIALERPLCLYSRLFNVVEIKQMFNINFAHDWIRTTDLLEVTSLPTEPQHRP